MAEWINRAKELIDDIPTDDDRAGGALDFLIRQMAARGKFESVAERGIAEPDADERRILNPFAAPRDFDRAARNRHHRLGRGELIAQVARIGRRDVLAPESFEVAFRARDEPEFIDCEEVRADRQDLLRNVAIEPLGDRDDGDDRDHPDDGTEQRQERAQAIRPERLKGRFCRLPETHRSSPAS